MRRALTFGLVMLVRLLTACTPQIQQQTNTVLHGLAALEREDYATALRELQPLAQQGNAAAQTYLGIMYGEGQGVAKDDAEAVRWLRQAAAQGNAVASFFLGVMYKEGRGVVRDLAEAQRLLAKAAATLPPGPVRDGAIQARDRVARELASTQTPASPAPPPVAVSSPPQPPPPLSSSVASPAPVSVPPSAPSRTMEAQRTATAPPTQSLDSDNIPLVKKGGVYQLPVEINGVITLHFILDTGAADINIPVEVVLTLIRTGTVRDADFLPGKMYTLADGSTVKSPRFLLRSLKIGQRRVTNVAASIGPVSSKLLLGQSFLEKLGPWGLDSQRQVLTLGTQGQRREPPPRQTPPPTPGTAWHVWRHAGSGGGLSAAAGIADAA